MDSGFGPLLNEPPASVLTRAPYHSQAASRVFNKLQIKSSLFAGPIQTLVINGEIFMH